ncbi:hypothetical protein SFRURICE_017526 [Spodoptera frugiperda]|nr:hypothetical protein SFRURICE_017526 [Spodoptera frugiperda]
MKTDRKSQRTTVGQKARQADHPAWSEDPPFLRELYSLFPKGLEIVNPQAAETRINEANAKYFSNTSGFLSVGKNIT